MIDPRPAPTIIEVRRESGIIDDPPYSHITLVIVAHNEEARLPTLLERVRHHFTRVVIAVQRSSDSTEKIARKWADEVVLDEHHGFGDASMPKLMHKVRSRWAFRLDADEMPSPALLWTMSNATWWAEREGAQGIWIPYHSSVEGMVYEQEHSHLRLWETIVPWPPLLHSRPDPERQILWTTGRIDHTKTLDEFVDGYLSYLRVGRDNPSWTEHNLSQLQNVCRAAAARYGWSHVTQRPWWPEVVAEVFDGRDPSATAGQ
jgi:hypothetical protein